ncbi:flagellar basal-body rod protein FlgF [Hyphomicrobium methylovorum]|uniref:flagellar basal-body rod protein FlgF n=1 Tax=Hyphomicrobium methylovorum TaxID=84 RepID=UPI0015E6C515|nr:flagellar basal-body rod protein FlgF [Hyphomicrobium methylovorum]MBA2125963.1 flagellar basal-body rod protein FlgF [Hyphomicrobium methylovorum]
MQSNIYVGLSAQLALQKRLDTVANNVANANTSGFRAEQLSFEELVQTGSGKGVSFVSKGENHLSTQAGELMQTKNPLDIAVRGDAWLSIRTPTGTAYTRDGRMQISKEGMLMTLAGDPFLDAGGSPLQLDPEGGPPVINKAGTVEQDGNNLGALGLYRMPRDAKLMRANGASVTSNVPPVPEIDFVNSGVVQGYVEKSNVNAMMEMTHLISLQRSFDAVSTVLNNTESSLKDSLRTIAGS